MTELGMHNVPSSVHTSKASHHGGADLKQMSLGMCELTALCKPADMNFKCDKPLEERCRDHVLEGKCQHHRELHIKPNCLRIYQIKDGVLILELSRTSTHSDLFKK